MIVLGIRGSPRKNGNSDLLLDQVLRGATDAGAVTDDFRCARFKISGCLECGGCEETGKCVIDDDMQKLYPRLLKADAIVLAVPVFFYAAPAQAKLVIDRCQALWCKRMLEKTPEQRKSYDGGRGYVVGVGASRGEKTFLPIQLEARYFFDALDMSLEDGLYCKGIEKKGEIEDHPEQLTQAYELGRTIAGRD